MQLKLYNTLSRRKEIFQPLDPKRVTMYVCGPTVYNYAHIGNARPPVVFDVLYRLLRRHYEGVVYARNITDVDDKINAAAHQAGVSIGEITEKYIEAYEADMRALGNLPQDINPRATDHMAQMRDMIQRLIDSGHAYEAKGHVLFRVASFADYGRLSRKDVEDLVAGARVEVAPFKESPTDFVLWKPSDETQPGWDSPWGRGRPGWHIECSAMIEAHLGETIDIHCGGQDLVFPHHENELAQSTCCHGGATFCRYWLHNGFLTMDRGKMSKSLGNVLLIKDLRERHPPEAMRYLLLSAHYRQPLDWSEESLIQARNTLDRYYGVLRDLKDLTVDDGACQPTPAFEAALMDDLNSPKALAELAAIARAANSAEDEQQKRQCKAQLLGCGRALGLLQADPDTWFEQGTGSGPMQLSAARIEALIEARAKARAARDFAAADRIRDDLAAEGIELEDGAEGTRWKRN